MRVIPSFFWKSLIFFFVRFPLTNKVQMLKKRVCEFFFFFAKHVGTGRKDYKNPRFDTCTSFVTMPSSKTPDRVCLLIDLEEFFLNGVFKCREMGWRSWNYHRGNIKYKMPHYFDIHCAKKTTSPPAT